VDFFFWFLCGGFWFSYSIQKRGKKSKCGGGGFFILYLWQSLKTAQPSQPFGVGMCHDLQGLASIPGKQNHVSAKTLSCGVTASLGMYVCVCVCVCVYAT
jgi:hypothetical protein